MTSTTLHEFESIDAMFTVVSSASKTFQIAHIHLCDSKDIHLYYQLLDAIEELICFSKKYGITLAEATITFFGTDNIPANHGNNIFFKSQYHKILAFFFTSNHY